MINCLQKSTNIVKTSKTIIIGIRIIAKPPSELFYIKLLSNQKRALVTGTGTSSFPVKV
jgi:hypothetical protein